MGRGGTLHGMRGEDQTWSHDQVRQGARAGQFRLLVVQGTTSSLVDLPPQGILLVGRAPEADIPLTDRSASRRHARLFVEEGGVRVADLESHNGVRVNGQAVSQVHPLQPGDVVSLGEVQLVLYAGAGGVPWPPSGAPGAPVQAEELVLGERVIVVADPALQRLYGLIRRLASSELPVLILGETGAGKENAAFALHHWSPRGAKPFVAINCATIAESLAESELFGHEKGAFTGAAAPKPGLLETAAGGTVFLDEVGELPLASQAKLLRALETRRILRVGSTKEREIDIRIVAATHRHLEKEVETGRFRKDLFFRLGAASVVLPPLRDRPGEIGVLARRFLAEACGGARPPPALSAAFLEALGRYDWPGNVRELKNTLGYIAATVVEETVEPSHLPERILAALRGPARPEAAPPAPPPAPGPPAAEGPAALAAPGPRFAPLAEELRALEKERMAEALRATGGVKVRAAELLGMPLRTFTLKCKQYGL
jgi:DNA-binding NtrC family response regulator